MRSLFVAILCFLSASISYAQSAAPLNVFVECDQCYTAEMKEKLTFVHYVRDRAESDVHIQTHYDWLDGGGKTIHLMLLGQGKYASLTDTFEVRAESWESETQIYNKLERLIRAGLVRFLAHSENLDRVQIVQESTDGEDTTIATAVDDPWDHWKVQLSFGGWMDGESNYDNLNANSALSIYRITKGSKYSFSYSNSYNENNFEFSDGSNLKSLSRSNSISASTVQAISDRFSLGFFGDAMTSTYYNLKRHFVLSPGIEYSFFPYEESSFRHLMLQYRIKAHYFKYIEETLYDQTEEELFDQSLKLAFLLRKDWGSLQLDLTGSNFLHDISLAKADLYSVVSLNVISGLSLDLYASLQYANDQIYLPKHGATEEETLLRRKQLKTNYSYWLNVGFSYTFGSSDASVVNSRFGS